MVTLMRSVTVQVILPSIINRIRQWENKKLHRLNNQKFVTVMSFIWNGSERKSVMEIRN